MPIYLKNPDGLLRVEESAEVIATLKEKGWTENPPPSYDADTQQPPAWNGAAWIVADLSAEEIAARNALPDAKRYQLKVWLVRNGIPLATVPSIIESAIAAGPEREEALVRWHDVELVPADHPLVAIVAAGMTPPVTVADVWAEILAIR